METPTINPPTKATLRRYGLSEDEWRALLDEQGGVCGVCGKVPTTGRLVIDHEHRPKWKAMAPEVRKTFVRGLTCWWDNATFLGRGATVARLQAAPDYLRR